MFLRVALFTCAVAAVGATSPASTGTTQAPPEDWHRAAEPEKMKGLCYLNKDTCVDRCGDGKGPGWAYECVEMQPYHCCRVRKCDANLGPAKKANGGFVCIPSPGVTDCCDPEGEAPACASGTNSGGCVEWTK